MRMLENLPIYQTEATQLLAVLDHKKAGVSTNVWLRILHNRALDHPQRCPSRSTTGMTSKVAATDHDDAE